MTRRRRIFLFPPVPTYQAPREARLEHDGTPSSGGAGTVPQTPAAPAHREAVLRSGASASAGASPYPPHTLYTATAEGEAARAFDTLPARFRALLNNARTAPDPRTLAALCTLILRNPSDRTFAELSALLGVDSTTPPA